ncbi:hypothetical protein [Streptomyces sp. NPDC056549]|uniref:hypothetical protein n=1 Tax=Streptomyces sp. NPDC056549 TaxID=3345864 RepID=UPI00369A9C4F
MADRVPVCRPHQGPARFRQRTLEAGQSLRSVQWQLGMAWHTRTVKRFAEAEGPEDLFNGQWQNRRSVLDDYMSYLDDRWNECLTNGWKLWEEIVPLGYKGSYRRVRASCTRSAPHRDR